MCGLILASLFPTHVCMTVRMKEGAGPSVWEMLQRGADLYRLATPVHRGQSASNRKCVYKWGSYFYCFCHFARSTISLFLSLSHSLSLSRSLSLCLFFLERPLTFFCTLLPSTCFGSLITVHELVFRSFIPIDPGFQDSRSPLRSLLPWFPRFGLSVQGTAPGRRTPFHRNPSFGQLASKFILFYFNETSV